MSHFISHDASTLAIEDNEYTQFLQKHWENDVVTIWSLDDNYETIYDFGGFSEELNAIKYPVKGSTEVASQLQEMLKEAT